MKITLNSCVRNFTFITLSLLLYHSAFSQVGSWPAGPADYVYFGTSAPAFPQTNPANYALLQSNINGSTFLNSPNNLSFRIGNIEKMILLNSGYFGIGVAPSYPLDVSGFGARIRNPGTALDQYTGFRLQGPDYAAGLEIDFFGNNNINSNINWSYGGGAGSAAIVNVNAKPLVLGTSNQGRILIDAAGNVGIGTNAPGAQLQVVSGNRKVSFNETGESFSSGGVISMTRADGQKTVYLGSTLGDESALYSGGGGTEMRLVSGNGSSMGFGFYLNLNQTQAFASRSTLPQPAMKIDGNGNVGIGTTTLDAKLTVKGDIHTKEVRVDVSGGTGPDYVFEKDYNLLPLSELENYITKNKHLPEVPSAKEMEAEGLNLKEMNLLLLKKVEELTLHLIEQAKEMEKIKKQNNEIVNENGSIRSTLSTLKNQSK